MSEHGHEDSIGSDILRGIERIGEFIGVPQRRAHMLASSGTIPARRELGSWVASKTELREFYAPCVQK